MLEPLVRIELFAGPRIWVNGKLQPPLQEKPAALLALLALAPNRTLSRDDLIEALWPEDAPDDPYAALRTHLSKIRSLFPRDLQILSSRSPSITLKSSPDVVLDTDEFDAFLKTVRKAPTAEDRLELLSTLESLYRGPLMPGSYIDEIVRQRHNYEAAIEEVRKTHRHLREAMEARQPISAGTEAPPASQAAPSAATNVVDSVTDRAGGNAASPSGRRVSTRAALAALVVVAASSIVAASWLSLRGNEEPRPLTVQERLRAFLALDQPAPLENPVQMEARCRQRARLLAQIGAEASAAWRTKDEPVWLENLDPADDAISSTVEWMVENDADAALGVLGHLSHYWSERGKIDQPLSWLKRAFQREGQPNQDAKGWALLAYGVRLLVSADIKKAPARQANRQALDRIREAQATFERSRNQRGLANALRCEAHVLHALGQDQEARQRCDQAIHIFKGMHDSGGEAAAWWCRSLFAIPGERPPYWYLRTTDDALVSAHLMAGSGCHSDESELWKILVPYAGALLDQPAIRSEPAAFVLLNRFAEAARARLARPEAIAHPDDVLPTRRMLARVALRLLDRETAVIQLGHLLSPHGDPELRGGAHCARLTQTYLDNFPTAQDVPIPRFNAQQMVINYGGGRPVKPLPLDAAIRIAAH